MNIGQVGTTIATLIKWGVIIFSFGMPFYALKDTWIKIWNGLIAERAAKRGEEITTIEEPQTTEIPEWLKEYTKEDN